MDKLPVGNVGQTSLVGERIGKYNIRRVIGSGGMGLVYEAEDTVLGRRVAVKTLRDELAADAQTVQRFLHEAQTASRIAHPHVVTVYDVVEASGRVMIVMEFVDGGSAEELLRETGVPDWRTATQVTADACRGLVAAHRDGLIHRDVKPSNIMLSKAEPDAGQTGKLADFGLAKYHASHATTLTASGISVGTPHFMSPEQCRAEPTDHRSDLYALGATYFKLLTGRYPFEGEKAVQVLFAHCSASVPDPATLNPTVDSRCRSIVDRAMAKEPHERFQSASAMLAALEDLLGVSSGREREGPPPSVPSRQVIASTPTVAHRAVTPKLGVPPVAAWRSRRLLAGTLLLCGLLALVASGYLGWAPPSDSGGFSATNRGKPMSLAIDGVMGTMRVAGGGTQLIWGASDRGHAGARLMRRDLTDGSEAVLRNDEREFAKFSAAVFLPKSDWLVVADMSAILAVDLQGSDVIPLLEVANGTVRSLAAHPSGDAIALAIESWDGDFDRIEMYELSSEGTLVVVAERSMLAGQLRGISTVAYSPNGMYLAVAAGTSIHIGDARTGDVRSSFELPGPLDDNGGCGCFLAFSPDSRLLASSGRRGITMWSVQNGRQTDLPPRHRDPISVVAFHPSGDFIASASPGGIRLWHVASGDQLGDVLPGHGGNVVSDLGFAEQGRTLVSAGFDNVIRFWDVAEFGDRSAVGPAP